MVTLIKNGRVYSPEKMGQQDILILFDRIYKIAPEIDPTSIGLDIQVIDATNHYILPGIIDTHVHLIGGGGEGGWATRTKELEVQDLTAAGITTVCGVLGTDGVTRSLETLYGKVKELNSKGITAYMYAGSYGLPINTIIGDVKKDMTFIEEILGVGEVAISDHRASQPIKEEILRLLADIRVSGMVAGKQGLLVCHLGDDPTGLRLINEITEEHPYYCNHMLPTHVNRNESLFKEGLNYSRRGGFIDITAGFHKKDFIGCVPVAEAMKEIIRLGLEDRVTITSDGNGSMPVFGPKGELIGIEACPVNVIYEDVFSSIRDERISVEKILKTITINPAKRLGIDDKKGAISFNKDADLLILNEEWKLSKTVAKGRVVFSID